MTARRSLYDRTGRVIVLMVVTAVGSLVVAASAQAASATVGMPFAGQWAYNADVPPPYTDNNSSHPSKHRKYYGDWATDIYAGGDTPVRLQVAPSAGRVSLRWVSRPNGNCGQRRVIAVAVDGKPVGSIYYEHLSRAASTAKNPKNGMVVGYVGVYGCNPGPHVHFELKGAACWTDNGRPGTRLPRGAAVGILNSNRPGRACPKTDRQAPKTPLGLNVAGQSASTIAVAWGATSDNVGVVAFDLYRDGQRVASTTRRSHRFSGLACGTAYTLGVAARDAAGNRSQAARVRASTSACTGGDGGSGGTGGEEPPPVDPNQLTWKLRDGPPSSGEATNVFNYGANTDLPLVGNWDGSGGDSIGVARRGAAELLWKLRDAAGPGVPDLEFTYGDGAVDIPVTGNWDGVGAETIGIARPGGSELTWKLRNSLSSGLPDYTFTYGAGTGDIPVTGNWDGVGGDTIGIARPGGAELVWKLRNSLSSGLADYSFSYGAGSGDIPVVGDWNGDGTDTIGIVRQVDGELLWKLRNSNSAGPADIQFTYGAASEAPIVGNWDGAEGASVAVVR